MYSKCCGQLFIVPVLMVTLFEKYYNTMVGLIYVSSEVNWSGGERDRLLKHWELWTSGLEVCIAY